MSIGAVFDEMEKTAAQSIKAEQGDYILDGLLYCGKCKTAKQTRVTIFGKERKPFCLCKCEVEKREREEEARKRAEYEKRIQEMRRAGFPDNEMINCTFEKDDNANAHLSSIAHKYVDGFQTMRENGKGLLLFGTVGTGKTFTAACIVNALIDKGYPCLATNFARLTNTISGMYDGKQEYIDGLNRFDLLVIDDLASERNTEYMNEIIYNIIDNRYRAKLPLIITTNLTPQELKHADEIKKQRIYSRLFEMCLPVEVKGTDRRRERLKTDFKSYADILGL